ncbi:hypothetical protein CC78DRAFT_578918 [Lojkania enalia]|uniref:Uncharacterized protein n=1 Tax=Lojkania enalia TaxID=147567 RepID=A0A9P4KAL3_9PLEO|nr:hypothetical protein CC78DRAFT_578918 [Didymosphaeria enalia]
MPWPFIFFFNNSMHPLPRPSVQTPDSRLQTQSCHGRSSENFSFRAMLEMAPSNPLSAQQPHVTVVGRRLNRVSCHTTMPSAQRPATLSCTLPPPPVPEPEPVPASAPAPAPAPATPLRCGALGRGSAGRDATLREG